QSGERPTDGLVSETPIQENGLEDVSILRKLPLEVTPHMYRHGARSKQYKTVKQKTMTRQKEAKKWDRLGSVSTQNKPR
ncbi:hypothetical protein, partial [Lacticaseibacillus paracasei]|uniref:hypothetical protein n=1 Tax=Lacticaseibacillus paracasei TaxID=1597 RepID=UPI002F268D87